MGDRLSEPATNALNYAVFLVKAYGAKLWIVHVIEGPLWYGANATAVLYLEAAQKEAERHLPVLEKQLAERELTAFDLRQVTGMPSEQINKVAQEAAADMVVVGTRGRSGLGTILLGSTAERVIKGAPLSGTRCAGEP